MSGDDSEKCDEGARNKGVPWISMRCFFGVLLLAALFLAPRSAGAETGFDLGSDKAIHFAAGLGIAGLGYILTAEFLDHPALRVAVGGSLALVAGGAKELYDLAGHGDADFLDFAFDVLGACVGVLIAYAIDRTIAHRVRRRRSSPALTSAAQRHASLALDGR